MNFIRFFVNFNNTKSITINFFNLGKRFNKLVMAETSESHTKLLYLNDTYKFEGNGKILSTDRDTKGPFVILDETIFYPQGGGQPSDIGTIQVDEKILNINFVSFLNGLVKHYLKEDVSVDEIIGKNANLKIDSSRRIENAKSHTSGHLIASIVEMLAPELIATKGYHFPEGPYVEFAGKLNSLSSDDLIKKISEISKEKINSGMKVIAREVNPEDLNQRNPNFELQAGKKTRLVEIEGYQAVPCGGTHLSNLSELKHVTIRKIQFPKGNTKIAYSYN
jgi:alanyl-tRNA synthetase